MKQSDEQVKSIQRNATTHKPLSTEQSIDKLIELCGERLIINGYLRQFDAKLASYDESVSSSEISPGVKQALDSYAKSEHGYLTDLSDDEISCFWFFIETVEKELYAEKLVACTTSLNSIASHLVSDQFKNAIKLQNNEQVTKQLTPNISANIQKIARLREYQVSLQDLVVAILYPNEKIFNKLLTRWLSTVNKSGADKALKQLKQLQQLAMLYHPEKTATQKKQAEKLIEPSKKTDVAFIHQALRQAETTIIQKNKNTFFYENERMIKQQLSRMYRKNDHSLKKMIQRFIDKNNLSLVDLSSVVKFNNPQSLRVLLNLGAKLTEQDLAIAIKYEHQEVITTILDSGVVEAGDLNLSISQQFLSQCRRDSGYSITGLTNKLVLYGKNDKNFNINTTDTGGRTALHYACVDGNMDLVKLLLKNGADVNAKTAKGNTPLHIACMNSNVQLVTLLKEKGALLHNNAKDQQPLDLVTNTWWGAGAKIKKLFQQDQGVTLVTNTGTGYVSFVAPGAAPG